MWIIRGRHTKNGDVVWTGTGWTGPQRLAKRFATRDAAKLIAVHLFHAGWEPRVVKLVPRRKDVGTGFPVHTRDSLRDEGAREERERIAAWFEYKFKAAVEKDGFRLVEWSPASVASLIRAGVPR